MKRAISELEWELAMDEITLEEFQKLDLRVGEIKEVSEHPRADKLLVIKVDLGGEMRQLVAGIKSHYDEEELIGKKIIVVANLKPAELRGIKSEGMILAASSGDDVVLLEPEQDIKNGAKVR